MDQKTEAEIVIRILNGDKQAYALLVDEYKSRIYNLAYRMTQNSQDAEDLAQETFLRSFKELHRYDTNRSFYTWLFTISLNLIRNHLKQSSRRRMNHADVDISSDVTLSSAQHASLHQSIVFEDPQKDQEKKLENSLQKLPPDLRELLVLRFYQQFSFETLSEITGFSQSAVKMRVYLGLEKLKEMMGKM